MSGFIEDDLLWLEVRLDGLGVHWRLLSLLEYYARSSCDHGTMHAGACTHDFLSITTPLPLHTQRKCQVLRLEVVFDCHSCQWNWSNNKAYLFCTETILLWVNCSPLLFNDNGLQHVARWQPSSSGWLNIMAIKWLARWLAQSGASTPSCLHNPLNAAKHQLTSCNIQLRAISHCW